ncbi:hypothetical protein D8674_031110 [Pyrus ussuriensis x Pyrus communis]|uniref:Uncharacterized protein n=1 Tax=Pyrus ussuriensis x Pyrus communis TaxID=2448454 RepID=A0A5N5F387_9ROSA|nr:hypothetical protein D8674_031110 [Pyrus ussuriensis x Pyrus communis]
MDEVAVNHYSQPPMIPCIDQPNHLSNSINFPSSLKRKRSAITWRILRVPKDGRHTWPNDSSKRYGGPMMGNAIQVFGLQQNQAQLGATRIEEINENNYGQGSNNPAYATNRGNKGKSIEEQAHTKNLSIFARMGLKRGTERKNKCIFQPPQKKARKGKGSSSRGRRGRERFKRQDIVNIERMELQDKRECDGS